MSASLRFSPRFLSELEANIAWYELRRPGLGAEFEQDVYCALTRVRDFPQSAATWRKQFRAVRLKVFNHAIVYEFAEDQVFVVGLFHGSQDPEHWLENNNPA